MKQEELVHKLREEEFISAEQLSDIEEYRALGIFSLHNELLFLLYLAVLLFTTGIGILIYKNIDSIGHGFILGVLFLVTAACFYFSFKKSKGFSREDVDFENPVYNYLVLAGTILCCIFMGYFQFQYQVFGANYSWATLVSALFGFGVAYYFNNKSALSIAITALATTIGISLTPKDILENDIYNNPMLSYYGLALGVLLLVWNHYSGKMLLKKHFSLVFLTFAQHLIGLCCIAGLTEDYWFVFVLLMAASMYYFYRVSYQTKAISIFTFTLVYAYIGFNIFLFRLFDIVDLDLFGEFIIIMAPLYFIGSIVGFIQLIKQFNKKAHDSIQ
ncbi:DUF2157 domain-containing protein [Flavobacterium humi]|uniref:DUF2157 domain-containing protein n=1 Tax=Flavobacterium humi TaxID=2562683 RepID=A0A4Z0L829_9FLAO|nr:DUF2157 domain-containing protein [Flavobacterium humi]TGD58574.1 DUF2157 domain-containing protein [Flavobacterium humi]